MKKKLFRILASPGREAYALALVLVAIYNPQIMRFTGTGMMLEFLAMVVCIAIALIWKPKKRSNLSTIKVISYAARSPHIGMAGAFEDFIFLGIPASLIMLGVTGWWITPIFAIIFAGGHGYKSMQSRVVMVFEQIFLVWVVIHYGLLSTFIAHYCRDMFAHHISRMYLGKRKLRYKWIKK